MKRVSWWRRQAVITTLRWPPNAPHKTHLLVVILLGGLFYLIAPASGQNPIDAIFPRSWTYTYYGGLVAMSAVCLWGIWRRGINGLLAERFGLIVLSLLSLSYVSAVVSSAGWHAVGATLFYAAFVTANVRRIIYIGQDLRALHHNLLSIVSNRDDQGEA